jgi:hypothetical protein
MGQGITLIWNANSPLCLTKGFMAFPQGKRKGDLFALDVPTFKGKCKDFYLLRFHAFIP